MRLYSGVMRQGSPVPRCGHWLWLLDAVPSETEADGNRGMIFWSKGLIFLFIFSGSLRPLQGQHDVNSPDILKCCEMLMETIFTWVATTSDTRVHARHTHGGTPTRTLALCPFTLDRHGVQNFRLESYNVGRISSDANYFKVILKDRRSCRALR